MESENGILHTYHTNIKYFKVNKLFKLILKIIGVLIVGALGALLFNLFLLPYMVSSPYFENFEFVKYFKDGNIIVNKTDQIYIQENIAIQNAIEKVKKSIVAIQSAKLGLASGMVVTSDGLVVTLASVIPASGNFTVFLQGQQVSFTVVKIDAKNNLALIKIDKNNLPTVGFANTDEIKLGQRVFLAMPTSTKADNWIANEGIVRQISQDAVQTTISENSVLLGSPLFNTTGELVGMGATGKDGKIFAASISKIQALLGL